MFPSLYAALVHYPATNKHGRVVSTAITNLDIHDIARAARTFGLRGYYLVTPVEAQHWLARRIVKHWEAGWGAEYNPNRKEALGLIDVCADIGQVAVAIESQCGHRPLWVATSARHYPNTITFSDLRARLWELPEEPICLLFGTGWGLHPDLVMEADLILEPIHGVSEYNHLSVRSAATIIFDRLLSQDRATK
jgi:hypothetical protein